MTDDYYTRSTDVPIVSNLPGQQTQPIQPTYGTVAPVAPTQYFATQYNPGVFTTNWGEILKRVVKYLFEGLAVAFVAYFFTKKKLNLKEIVLLGVTAAFVFAILDTFSPTVALGTRFGAGFGIGQTMFGLNPAPALLGVQMM